MDLSLFLEARVLEQMKCQTVKSLSLSVSEYLKIEIKEGINLLSTRCAASRRDGAISSPNFCVCKSMRLARRLLMVCAQGSFHFQATSSQRWVCPLHFFKAHLPKFLFVVDLGRSILLASLTHRLILTKVLPPGAPHCHLWILPQCLSFLFLSPAVFIWDFPGALCPW